MHRFKVLIGSVGVLALMGWVAIAQPMGNPALQWDKTNKDAVPEPGETSVKVVFVGTNTSASEIQILGTRTSCGCTVAQLPVTPYKLGSGSNVQINVTMDLRGKFGQVTKSITVDSSVGPYYLTLSVKVPDPSAAINRMTPEQRARNQEVSKADRQAVFRGDCASCHATPAINKVDKELFDKSCGVCHDAEHRATMVPDLRNPKRPVDRTYWADIIMFGKKDTLMPAFSQAQGGFMTDDQIFSLVEYMVGAFQQSASPVMAKPKP